MKPVSINMGSVAEEFQLTRQETTAMTAYVIKGLTARYAKTLENVAKQSLGKTRNQFIRSIVVGEQGPLTGYVMITGSLANMIESGSEPFDMKKGFLGSRKAVTGLNGGKYLTVPFRQATPGALGESAAFANIMPEGVYSAIKTKDAAMSSPSGSRRGGSGLKPSEIPKQYRIPRTRAMIVTKNKTFEEYKHKHSIYEGMVKNKQTYESASSSTYVTFRRVSKNSDPNSWIYPGMEGKNLTATALNRTNIPHEVDVLADSYLAKLGF